MKKFNFYTAILILIIFIISVFLPSFKSTALKELSFEEKQFVEFAVFSANFLYFKENSISSLMTIKTVVQEIKKTSDNQCIIENRDGTDKILNSEYSAIIDAYTFFGFHWGSVKVNCRKSCRVGYCE